MSSKMVYVCDHCGAECSGDQYASIGRWEEPKATIFGKNIHGCSKEHLGLALAKAFGFGIDGKATELLVEKNNKLAALQGELLEERNARQSAQRDEYAVREQLSEARTELREAHEWFTKNVIPTHTFRGPRLTLLQRIENLMAEYNDNTKHFESFSNEVASQKAHISQIEALANQYKSERDHLEETCRMLRELAKPPVDATGKTPGQVAFETQRNAVDAATGQPPSGDSWDKAVGWRRETWEASAQAVLRAFGQNAVEALRRVRERLTIEVHGWANMGTFTPGQRDSFAATFKSVIDDELTKLEGKSQ